VVTGRSRPNVGPVQPSSLIFLVIVAIWAAYLIQHWVRRREHVATARSVDRFSEAMRVLERRSPLPSSELSAPRPHSYAVKPASTRPAVTVKRAVAAQAAPRGARATATVTDRHALRSPLAARSAGGATTGRSASARSPRPGTRSSSGRPTGTRLAAGPTAVGHHAAGRPARSASAVMLRRIRGVSFLVTLASIPVTVVLSALYVLLWVSVAVSVVAFAAVVVWLRTSVVREQAARAAARPAAGRGSSVARASHADEADRPGATASSATEVTATPALTEREVAAAVFDVNAPVTTDEVAVAVAQQVCLQTGMPGEWSPVPVPPPTYTLKDTATRPRPELAEVTQTPVPIEVEDDDIERMAAEHHRRVVGG